MHRTQRPGPLQELPLEPFLQPLDLDLPASSRQTRNNKRQLSPGQPSLFSPTKRRILSDEGIHLPEKTIKTPLPPSERKNLPSSVRFAHVPKSSRSPARVLNFGLPKNLQGDPQKRLSSSMDVDASQETCSSSTQFVSSPELKAETIPRPNPRRALVSQSDDISDFEDISSPSSSASAITPSLVPRELPPQTDPRSVHFPGFFVHRDTHIAVYPTVAVAATEGYQQGLVVDGDTHKENLPPRRRTKKLPIVSTNLASKDSIDACHRSWVSSGLSTLNNGTPKRSSTRVEHPSTITKSALRIHPQHSSPVEKKKALRQTMQDEMDLDEDDLDDA